MDVIVNTVARDLDLSHGAVSSSLLAVAGQGLQQECRSHVPVGKQLDFGQIIRTSGHQLPCTDVLHGPCENWDAGAGTCEQVTVLSSSVFTSVDDMFAFDNSLQRAMFRTSDQQRGEGCPWLSAAFCSCVCCGIHLFDLLFDG